MNRQPVSFPVCVRVKFMSSRFREDMSAVSRRVDHRLAGVWVSGLDEAVPVPEKVGR